MMKFILFALIMIMDPECYKVYYSQDIIVKLNANSIKVADFDTCLSTNKCFVYYLKSGEVFLLPNNYSNVHSKGILFYNKECYDDCLKKDHFPIENSKLVIEEKYANYIQNVDKKIDTVIQEMMLRFMPKNKEKLSDSTRISQLLLTLKSKKLNEKDLFYAALTLGEFVRRFNKGHWIILKRYGTYNPYYTPGIIYEDNSICLFWDYLKTYFKNPPLTPEKFSSLTYIKKPALNLNSNFFQNNFYGYLIFESK